MTRNTYQLDVTREGRWWMVDAVGIDYRTQARTLAEVDEMGRDLIAGVLEVDPASFDLDVRVAKPADVTALLAEAAKLDHEAQAAVSRAAIDRREAARTLSVAYGLGAVDTARVLGVTRGRVYQLLDTREKVSG